MLAAVAVTAACSGSSDEVEAQREPTTRAGGCRTTAASPRFREAIAAGRRLMPRLASGLRAPGLSLAVAVNGRIVWSVNCGVTSVRTGAPATDRTQFRIGSVSKPLTAATLAHYAAAGKVDLDAPIGTYLPSFRRHPGITLRRLAGHLGGIRHYETRAEVVNRRRFDSVQDTVEIVDEDPLIAPPGTRFSYSTYGYNVIGAALERATGREFAELVRVATLARAQLAHTIPGTARSGTAATFYEVTSSGGVRRAPPIDLSDRLPGGGFLSTARDLAVFGSVLATGRLVPPAVVKTMFTSQRTTAGEPTGYGLGFEIHPSPHGLFVGHTGAVVGGTSALVIHVPSGVSLGLATNVGYATAANPPPPPRSTPDPPELVLPFVKSAR